MNVQKEPWKEFICEKNITPPESSKVVFIQKESKQHNAKAHPEHEKNGYNQSRIPKFMYVLNFTRQLVRACKDRRILKEKIDSIKYSEIPVLFYPACRVILLNTLAPKFSTAMERSNSLNGALRTRAQVSM